MRVAVLVLVLANLAAFVWLRWGQDSAPHEDLVPMEAVGQPLVLLSTLPATALPVAAATASPREPASPFCLAWGPVASATVARGLAARARTNGGQLHSFTRMEPEPPVYRVVLVGFRDDEAAERAAAALRRGGVEDLFLRRAADGRAPSLSLGLFRDRDGALRRAARVRALGFEPEMREITRKRTVRYLQAEAPVAATVSAALRAAGLAPPQREACVSGPGIATVP